MTDAPRKESLIAFEDEMRRKSQTEQENADRQKEERLGELRDIGDDIRFFCANKGINAVIDISKKDNNDAVMIKLGEEKLFIEIRDTEVYSWSDSIYVTSSGQYEDLQRAIISFFEKAR